MTRDEFALKIKSKYPIYKDQDNDVLVGRILQKYPQYQSQVNQDSKLGIARQALSQTMTQDLPLVGKAVGNLRTNIPNQLAEKYGMPGAIAGTAIGTAGELLPKTGGDLALQGLTGPLLKGIGFVTKKGLIPLGRKVLPSLTEALTSIEAPIVERAIQRASQVGQKMKGVLDSNVTEMAVNKLKEATKDYKTLIGSKLKRIEDAVIKSTKKQIPIADIGDQLSKMLAGSGYKVNGYTEEAFAEKVPHDIGEILNGFNSLKSFSPDIASNVESGMTSKPVTFKAALNLRRSIDRILEQAEFKPGSVTKDTEAILAAIRKPLNDRLLATEPRFKVANDAYAKVMDTYRQLHDDVLTGKEETVRNRIARIFKKGSVERKLIERMDNMGKQAAGQLDDLLDTITAQQFSSKVNPQMTRSLKSTGGGLAARAMQIGQLSAIEGAAAYTGHPFLGPAAVGATAVATSPKLNFRVIQASKKIAQELMKLGLGPESEIGLSLTAPKIHDAILNHAMDQHLNDSASP